MTVRILTGDCREVLATLPDESVHCCVTSPPYFGLRDYQVDGQMGLEASPDEYVAGMVALFREVRRVLRKDGTLWLNLGDGYAGNSGGGQGLNGKLANRTVCKNGARKRHWSIGGEGLKGKDLIGIPWMMAFALRADGWYLRQDIIWAKPNPMPESVRDRCTKAHEHIFLLAKSARYYFDQAAIAEPATFGEPNSPGSIQSPYGQGYSRRAKSGNKARKPASARGCPQDVQGRTRGDVSGAVPWEGTTRNKRDVWTVATRPFPEAHFATFPPDLIEPCILAGCPEGGTVLDPFGGAGTTGLVADRHHRDAVLIELNPDYADMARRRIGGEAPLFSDVQA